MAPHSTAAAAAAQPASVQRCKHCLGSGREPVQPLAVSFSRSGTQRGAQAELSASTGIPAPTLSLIFSGQRTPTAANLLKIAQALGCSVDRVLSIPAIAARVAAA